jgi:hypothetical protein
MCTSVGEHLLLQTVYIYICRVVSQWRAAHILPKHIFLQNFHISLFGIDVARGMEIRWLIDLR